MVDVAGAPEGASSPASPVSSGRRREYDGPHASSPVRMQRARAWSALVENAYRLQEAGYKDEHEAMQLGHDPIERWPEAEAGAAALIRKLVTRETVDKEARSTIYFSKRRECSDKDLSKVKLYFYE